MESINYISIVIAGVTTGGLSCFVVQGGLLTSAIAHARKIGENSSTSQIAPVIAFITTKLIAYTIIGALLGAFGSIFNISSSTQAIIQVLIALYMLGVAGNLLNIHPLFRYFIIQPPFFLQKFIRKIAKGDSQLATPALLGVVTIFIPCGTTLAMEALAISTGSAIQGALIMAVFVLSSSWVFMAIGLTAHKLNQTIQSYFYKITAAALVILAFFSLNAGLNLLGFPYTLDSLQSQKNTPEVLAVQNNSPQVEYESQKITITIDSRGYTSSAASLKKGVPVELTLESKNSYSCANAFAIPSLNILKVMPENGTEKLTFTPTKSGKLVYSCSMGMFRGEFNVI